MLPELNVTPDNDLMKELTTGEAVSTTQELDLEPGSVQVAGEPSHSNKIAVETSPTHGEERAATPLYNKWTTDDPVELQKLVNTSVTRHNSIRSLAQSIRDGEGRTLKLGDTVIMSAPLSIPARSLAQPSPALQLNASTPISARMSVSANADVPPVTQEFSPPFQRDDDSHSIRSYQGVSDTRNEQATGDEEKVTIHPAEQTDTRLQSVTGAAETTNRLKGWFRNWFGRFNKREELQNEGAETKESETTKKTATKKESKRGMTRKEKTYSWMKVTLFFILGPLTLLLIIAVIVQQVISSRHSDVDSHSGFPAYVRITKQDPAIQQVMNISDVHRVFNGINYTPRNSQCGVTQKDVSTDMTILSQLTTKVRVYGTDCGQAAMILNAIKDLELNMTLSLGLWIDTSQETALRQLAGMEYLFENYPKRYINSVLVGNEVLFREDIPQSQLITYIDYVREYLHRRGITDVPVGTSEIGSKWTYELAEHVDVLAANIHPFFGGVNVNNSTTWTYDFLLRQVAGRVSPANVTFAISEVGWPSGGGSLDGAIAGLAEMQHFLNTWLCTNQQSDIGWYWFEAFDQPWKSKWNTEKNQWETQWGLFTADRKLKGIVIPDC